MCLNTLLLQVGRLVGRCQAPWDLGKCLKPKVVNIARVAGRCQAQQFRHVPQASCFLVQTEDLSGRCQAQGLRCVLNTHSCSSRMGRRSASSPKGLRQVPWPLAVNIARVAGLCQAQEVQARASGFLPQIRIARVAWRRQAQAFEVTRLSLHSCSNRMDIREKVGP